MASTEEMSYELVAARQDREAGVVGLMLFFTVAFPCHRSCGFPRGRHGDITGWKVPPPHLAGLWLFDEDPSKPYTQAEPRFCGGVYIPNPAGSRCVPNFNTVKGLEKLRASGSINGAVRAGGGAGEGGTYLNLHAYSAVLKAIDGDQCRAQTGHNLGYGPQEVAHCIPLRAGLSGFS